MILLDWRITKVLISLGGCAGWSAPVLSASSIRQVSRVKAHMDQHVILILIVQPPSFNSCMLGNFSQDFLLSADIFQHYFYSKFYFSVSNSLDPDRARHSVRPDLGSNCFYFYTLCIQALKALMSLCICTIGYPASKKLLCLF